MNIAVNPDHPLLLAMIALIAWTLVIWCSWAMRIVR